jgi:RHS repeat-associated protein
MVRRAHRTLLGIALVLVLGGVAGLMAAHTGRALAEDSSQPPQPTVVQEVLSRRTATSYTYLLSDGTYRCDEYGSAVNYKDESGNWQPIDPTLVPVAGSDAVTTEAAPVVVTVASDAGGQKPVTVDAGKWTVTMDLVGCAERDPAVDGPIATFDGIAPGASVSYTALGDGVKELVTLASSAAPNSYTYRLTHPGLEARQDEAGQWGLYAPDKDSPVFLVGPMNACDSSVDASDEPAYADGARMSVASGEGASTVTFSVPRTWLNDTARVWPVMIDPQIELDGSSTVDTYLSEGYSGTAFGSDADLLCGNMNSDADRCWTLVRFPQLDSDIPAGSHISGATFHLRQYWQPATHSDGVKVAWLSRSSTLWGNSSTWTSAHNGILVKSDYPTETVTGAAWMNVTCTGAVQYWLDSGGNRGFKVYELDSSGSGYSRKFRSNDYSDASYRPHITVNYESPDVSMGSVSSSYHIGDTFSVTAHATSVTNVSQIEELRIGVNRADADTSSYHGVLGWFKDPPTSDPCWVYQKCPGGGYVAYYDSTLRGITHIEPLLDSCSWNPSTMTATFAFRSTDKWAPLTSGNSVDAFLKMSAGSETWSTGWMAKTNSFTLAASVAAPDPVISLTDTTITTTSWVAAGAQSNDNSAGRGTITLSWAKSAIATGYRIYLFDGVKYDQVATVSGGSTTTWTSSSAMYPTDAQIAALPAGYVGNPFTDYPSCSLRDNPNALYQKMGGYTTATYYYFRVVPVNGTAATSIAECTPLIVTLDNRTKQAAEDANAHTVYDLGTWDGHDLACQLDNGRLTAATTDLEIATYGPAAALSRTYTSSATSAGLFAPGWFFGFEQSLLVQTSSITYTDAERQSHVFARSGSTCTAPNGFLGTLTADGSGWRLTFFDQSYRSFDSLGKLSAETNAGGEQTLYTWTGGQMTRITAANGQQVSLTYSGTKLQSASYATAAGTRTVNYATASPWQVTYFPGTGCQRTLTYGYDGLNQLTTLTQNDWPSTGSSATETFIYTSSKVTEVRFADYNATSRPDARATIIYNSATQATTSRYGTVTANGVTTANQPTGVEVFTWAPSTAAAPGLTATHQTGSGALALTESYAYAFDRQLAMTTSSDGGQTSDTYNTAHDLTATVISSATAETPNQLTTFQYDAAHRLQYEYPWQDPQTHAMLTYYYNASGELTGSRTYDTDNVTWLAAETHEYDASGRVTKDKAFVEGSTWTETQYSSFAPSGEPQTTVSKAIQLTYGGAAQDLTQTASYDAFGNLLSQTDNGGRATEQDTYDIAGNQLTSTDAAGIVTHTTYDRMGNATESWQTASGTAMKADWTLTAYDAVGNATSVTTKLSDGSGNGTVQSVVTPTIDGSGNELASNDSTVGGQSAKTLYDSRANAVQSCAEGAYDVSTAARSTRSVYDADGNVTYESEPGNAATPGPSATCQATAYAPDGSTLSEKQPDGAKTTYDYDGAGNQVASEANLSTATDSQPYATAAEFDVAGRQAGSTDPQHSHTGLETSSVLDALGRATQEVAVRDGVTAASTTTAYNNFGEALRSVDANGVTTSTTFNASGEATTVVKGSKTTTSAYDATTGRLTSTTDNDGKVISYTYDAFGNVSREWHKTSGGASLRDVNTSYDSLGRPTSRSEAVSHRSQTWSYPVDAATGTQETLDYSNAAPHTSLQITRNARGMETARTATIASGVTVTRAVADPSGRDAADRWTSASVQQSGRTPQATSRSFDAAGRLATQSGIGLTSAASYGYDTVSGWKTSQSLPLALGGAITDAYTYYAGGRLATATTGGVAATTTFDEVGNLVGEEATDVESDVYVYDAANRLTSKTVTPDADNAASTITYYGWDSANAWRTCQGPNASPTQANEPIDLSYNAQGRMLSYDNTDTDSHGDYTYDACGQRTKSVVTVGSTTTTTSYDYDGLTLLSLSATQGSTTWRVDYLYDEEGALYGGVYRSPATSTSPIYFTAVTNDHGDVHELCDADGHAFAAFRYDAWGLPQGGGSYATGIWTAETRDSSNNIVVSATLAGQIASRQILRYASYAYDSESGLYYCSARYYDPATRQWTTGDPTKADGEESAYQYAAASISDHHKLNNYKMVKQPAGKDWCWAASSVCAIKSLRPKIASNYPASGGHSSDYVMQERLAKEVFGQDNNHGISTPTQHVKWQLTMTRFWKVNVDDDVMNTIWPGGKPCSWDKLTKRIANHKPVLMSVRLGNGKMHVMVVYETMVKDGERLVSIMNPWGKQWRMSYDEACNHRSTADTKAWKWIETDTCSRTPLPSHR